MCGTRKMNLFNVVPVFGDKPEFTVSEILRQKEEAAFADVLRRQVGQRVVAITALIAAVHDKGRLTAFHKIAVPLLAAGIACQIELHEYLLNACAGCAKI